MAMEKQLDKRWITKKVTPEEDEAIKKIVTKRHSSYLEAKQIYFDQKKEEQHKEHLARLERMETDPKKLEAKKQAKEKGTPRKSMTIDQTKLGITMVISKEEAKKLGFTGQEPTSQAIREIRQKLGLGVV